MNYKINLQITGTIEVEEKDKQLSLLEQKELLSENQRYYLVNNTSLDSDIVAALTKEAAHILIGLLEKKRKAKEIIKPLPQDASIILPDTVKQKLSVTMKHMCTYPLCGKQAKVKGLCMKHYQQERNKRLKGGETK